MDSDSVISEAMTETLSRMVNKYRESLPPPIRAIFDYEAEIRRKLLMDGEVITDGERFIDPKCTPPLYPNAFGFEGVRELGRKMAREREEAAWRAIVGPKKKDDSAEAITE